jgi:hypothetical protein
LQYERIRRHFNPSIQWKKSLVFLHVLKRHQTLLHFDSISRFHMPCKANQVITCASLGWSYAKGLPPSSNEWTVVGTRPIVCILLTKYNGRTIVLMWKWVLKCEATILSQLSQQCELKFYHISPRFIFWDQNIQLHV